MNAMTGAPNPHLQTELHLTGQELEERVAILTRFREALIRQREKFRRYLEIIERGDDEFASETDRLEFHVEMEQSIVVEIASFQRAIEPLETMYRAVDPDGAREIPNLRKALDRTRDEVVRRHDRNRTLLRRQLEELRSEIANLRIIRSTRSLYATPEPELVDIRA